MADATIKSEMTMDNGRFLAATRESTASLRQVKNESREMAKQMSGANNVANGLASIMKGNLTQGLASVGSGLNALAPKIWAALGPIGLIVGAVMVAITAFKQLNKAVESAFNWISNYESKAEKAANAQRERESVLRKEKLAGMRKAQELDDETQRMAEQRLEGVAKLEADHARKTADLQKRIAKEKNEDIKNALQNRLAMMAGFHAQDVAAVKQAEAEKVEAVQRAEEAKLAAAKQAEADKIAASRQASLNRVEQIADENERMRISTLSGAEKLKAEYDRKVKEIYRQMDAPATIDEQIDGLDVAKNVLLQDRLELLKVEFQKEMAAAQEQPSQAEIQQAQLPRRMDAMAAVGGFLGGERTSLPVVSRAEQLQAENNQALKQNVAAVDKLTEQVGDLAAAMTGGVR